MDFLKQCLKFDEKNRALISDLLEHPFISGLQDGLLAHKSDVLDMMDSPESVQTIDLIRAKKAKQARGEQTTPRGKANPYNEFVGDKNASEYHCSVDNLASINNKITPRHAGILTPREETKGLLDIKKVDNDHFIGSDELVKQTIQNMHSNEVSPSKFSVTKQDDASKDEFDASDLQQSAVFGNMQQEQALPLAAHTDTPHFNLFDAAINAEEESSENSVYDPEVARKLEEQQRLLAEEMANADNNNSPSFFKGESIEESEENNAKANPLFAFANGIVDQDESEEESSQESFNPQKLQELQEREKLLAAELSAPPPASEQQNLLGMKESKPIANPFDMIGEDEEESSQESEFDEEKLRELKEKEERLMREMAEEAAVKVENINEAAVDETIKEGDTSKALAHMHMSQISLNNLKTTENKPAPNPQKIIEENESSKMEGVSPNTSKKFALSPGPHPEQAEGRSVLASPHVNTQLHANTERTDFLKSQNLSEDSSEGGSNMNSPGKNNFFEIQQQKDSKQTTTLAETPLGQLDFRNINRGDDIFSRQTSNAPNLQLQGKTVSNKEAEPKRIGLKLPSAIFTPKARTDSFGRFKQFDNAAEPDFHLSSTPAVNKKPSTPYTPKVDPKDKPEKPPVAYPPQEKSRQLNLSSDEEESQSFNIQKTAQTVPRSSIHSRKASAMDLDQPNPSNVQTQRVGGASQPPHQPHLAHRKSEFKLRLKHEMISEPNKHAEPVSKDSLDNYL